MNYLETLEYIHGTLKFGIKCGLDNIRTLLSYLENPQNSLKYVHVAGTNGKGSTCSFINSVLVNSGYNVGLYTSPYLERFNERIQVNGQHIPDEDLCEIATTVLQKIDEIILNGGSHPTEFEIVTAIGFVYFARKNCDIVVLEVGLGGRLDSTNIINAPEVCVITPISYDHMNILGNTISEIAFEKAGIIKPYCSVVVAPQTAEVFEIIESTVISNSGDIHSVYKSQISVNTNFVPLSINQTFDYRNFKNISISMSGIFQQINAATAIEALLVLRNKGFIITEENIRSGLNCACWPGRFETILADPLFIIDGAHNVHGAKALSDSLDQYYPDYNKIILIGLLKDKDIDNILDIIIPKASIVITATPFSDRAIPSEELKKIIESKYRNSDVIDSLSCVDSVEKALKICLDSSENSNNNSENGNTNSKKTLICACGSLYYIGEVRKYLLSVKP